MPDRTVIQWDKDDLDELGLLKVDVLGLGMLTAIRRAFDLVHGCRGRRWTLATVPAEDPAVYDMICHADTMGVFQIESRAQMAMLPRLRPRSYYDLVIEVAIVRPGPIQGDMVHPYLRRRAGEEAVTYPSAEVEGVLKRTLGVPIFQEQVMQLAVVAAGFTPGEADQLRRAMAAWKRKGGLGHFEERLIDGMRERGYSEEFARRIFQQILGFGEYGFPESHAASFALLVYVSAWLKRHEPAAFAAALINSQPMGFYAPSQIVQDAQRHGVEVRPIDVRTSDWDCTLEHRADDAPDPALRLGLRLVKGLAEEAAQRLVDARARRQGLAFESAQQLAEQASLDRRSMGCLAAAGALAGLGGHRHRAAWQVAGLEGSLPILPEVRIAEGIPLLRAPREGEDIVADYAHTGLTLRRHPIAVLRDQLECPRFRRFRAAALADERLERAHRGPRHHATAAGQRRRRHVRDARGRAWLDQPDRLARRGRAATPGIDRLTPAGPGRQAATGRRGDARDRASARRPEPLARPVTLGLARFSLTLARPRAVAHVVVVEVAQQLRRALLFHHAFELAPRGLRAFRRAALALVEVLHEAIDIEGFIAPDDFLGVFVLELVR